METNPFSMLFGGTEKHTNPKVLNEDTLQQEKDDMAERIFLITIQIEEQSGERALKLPAACVFVGMDDSIQSLSNVLNDCINTRLSYTDPENFVVDRREDYEANELDKSIAAVHGKLAYLYSCYQRIYYEKEKCENYLKPTISMWSDLIISNCVHAILYSNSYNEFSNLITAQSAEFSSLLNSFLYCVMDLISKNKRDGLLFEKKVRKTLSEFAPKVQDVVFGDALLNEYVTYLSVWAIHPFTAKLIVDQKITQGTGMVRRVTRTMMEVLLKKSGFVTNPTTQDFNFFERVSSAAHNSSEEMALQNAQSEYLQHLTNLYKVMCKNQQSRNYLMQWIGEYIEKNAFLGKMWPHQQINPLRHVLESDETFFNLTNIFLRLSQPFCSNLNNPQNPKLLKINPLYCGLTGIPTKAQRLELDVHIGSLNKETCFVPASEDYKFETSSEKINFITEIFFFTHRCMYLSCHGILEKFYAANRHLSRMERIYAEVQNMGESSVDITNAFERGMKVYLSSKACLTENNFVQLATNFYVTTAQYLAQISQTEDMTSFNSFTNISDENVSKYLSITPEFLVENIVDFVVFIHRFAKPSLSLFSFAKNDMMLMISIFMGSKNKMANPHLRCTLTDVVNAIFFFNDGPSNPDDMSGPIDWLENFPHYPQLTQAVIQLCVDMEISQDEQISYQKFGFRKTLYKVLKVIWYSEKCSKAIIEHAKYAYEHIEDTNHPLFLSFSNLILNDITYLLDEAMSHLISIKDAEKAQNEGEWDELNDEEKKQKKDKLEQDINIARYYNTLSNLTLETLSYLSTNAQVKKLLCHPVLVERVALMMNNFLLKLVGPRMGALRVQDFSRCNFEPKQLVCDICTIYTNMIDMDEFCQAVVKDGRSYDDKLLARAIRALAKINNQEVLQKFHKFSDKCKSVGVMEEEEEVMFEDAPEEFYDQLTYTIMLDPVTLPTSKKVVDRATISRHLLGDTRDPFNRQPLTMDQVIPNTEIKLQIQKWKEDWKAKKSQH